MGWKEGRFVYNVGEIQDIADNFFCIYTDWMCDRELDWRSAAESRADFCISLEKLSQKHKRMVMKYISGETSHAPRGVFYIMATILNGQDKGITSKIQS